jgi:thioredoxin 1
MKAIVINKNNFEEIKQNNKVVLIDFFANWCGPCKMLSPIIDEIAEERDDIVVGKVNVDSEPELAEKFNVFSIPTIVVIKDGKVAHQSAGARPKAQILDLL